MLKTDEQYAELLYRSMVEPEDQHESWLLDVPEWMKDEFIRGATALRTAILSGLAEGTDLEGLAEHLAHFFRWWYNQPGQNTLEGAKAWLETEQGQTATCAITAPLLAQVEELKASVRATETGADKHCTALEARVAELEGLVASLSESCGDPRCNCCNVNVERAQALAHGGKRATAALEGRKKV